MERTNIMLQELRIGVVAKREPVEFDLVALLIDKLTEVVKQESSEGRPIISLISTLAAGVSCIMVEKGLQLGLPFEAVIPCAGYAEEFEPGEQRRRYQRMIGRARQVHLLPFDTPSPRSYDAAARWIADASDLIFIVWDGDEVSEVADALQYAQRLGKRSMVLDARTAEPSFVLTGR